MSHFTSRRNMLRSLFGGFGCLGLASIMAREESRPADVARVRVDRVKLRRAAHAAGEREEDVVIERRRGAEAEAIADAPDDRAGEDVERGEGAVAAREVKELSGALHAQCAAGNGAR